MLMHRHTWQIASLLFAAAVVATPARAQDSTLLGAGAGAGGGAGIGFALGGPVGAVVGGLIGAGVGAGSGHVIGKQDKASSQAYAPASGSNADLTRSVQNELNWQGYNAGPADGRYGRRTADAVRAYQTNNGLPVDGQVSVALLDNMRARRAAQPAAQPVAQPVAQPAAVSVNNQPAPQPPPNYAPPPPAYAPAPPPPPGQPALPALPKAN